MAEFSRRIGANYEPLRIRASLGRDVFKPIRYSQDNAPPPSGKDGGYTLEELANLYSLFRSEEDALDILADFSGLRRGSSAVVRLERKIQTYLENLRKEVHGE